MLTWEASLTHDTAVLGTLQNSNINYSLGGNSPDYADTTNSNSTVASALASVGIDIYDNLPIKGGDLDGNGISDTLGTTTRYSVSDVPGVNTRLSGSESNTFDGGEAAHDNLFVDTAGSDGQSGDDTFYGGALGVQVLSNTADGHDTYIYLTPTVQALDWSIIEDGSTPIGLQVDTPDSHTDTLYSIERVFSTTFTTSSTLNFSNLPDGVHVHELDFTQLGALNTELNAFGGGSDPLTTSCTVELASGDQFTVGNVHSFTGSENGGDTFELSQVLGGTITGGGDGSNANTISYAGVADAGGATIDLDQELAWLNSSTTLAGPPTIGADTIENFQNAVGSAYDDLIVGTDAVNTLTGGLGDDTLIGGLGADTCYGGAGNDLFRAAASDDPTPVLEGDSYDGGTGIDTLDCSHLTLASGMGVVVEIDDAQDGYLYQYDSSTNNWSDDYDTFASIENLTLTAGNDFVYFDLSTDATFHTIDCVGGADFILLDFAILDATTGYIYNSKGEYVTTDDSSHFLNMGSSVLTVNTLLADVTADATYTVAFVPGLDVAPASLFDFCHATAGATFDVSGSYTGNLFSGTYDMSVTAHLPDSITQTIYGQEGHYTTSYPYIDTTSGLPAIAGTDHGDTFNIALGQQYPGTTLGIIGGVDILTGMGDDTVNVTMPPGAGVDLFYRGGDDVYNLTQYSSSVGEIVTLDEEIQIGDVTQTAFVTATSGGATDVTHVQLTVDDRGTVDLYSSDLNGINVYCVSGGYIHIDTTGTHFYGSYNTSTATSLTWNDDVYTIRSNALGELDALGGNDTITGSSNDNLIYLGAGNDVAHGNSGADTIYGAEGTDTIYGDGGADTLDGGDGLDSLTGGTGSDVFVFHAATAFNNVDVVGDFSTSDGDKIDISDVLTTYNAATDNISDFVQLVTSGSDTLLKVDLDGAGTGHSMTQIATLTGVTGLSLSSLITSGELVVS